MVVNLARGYEGPGEVVVTHPQELAAWYIQASGNTTTPECDQCVHADESSRARPFFRFCVVSGALQGGACGSCVLKHSHSHFRARRRQRPHAGLCSSHLTFLDRQVGSWKGYMNQAGSSVPFLDLTGVDCRPVSAIVDMRREISMKGGFQSLERTRATESDFLPALLAQTLAH
jgi:hypothetical protein